MKPFEFFLQKCGAKTISNFFSSQFRPQRLSANQKCHAIYPRGDVRNTDHANSFRRKHATKLFHQFFRFKNVFENMVATNKIKTLVGKWQWISVRVVLPEFKIWRNFGEA